MVAVETHRQRKPQLPRLSFIQCDGYVLLGCLALVVAFRRHGQFAREGGGGTIGECRRVSRYGRRGPHMAETIRRHLEADRRFVQSRREDVDRGRWSALMPTVDERIGIRTELVDFLRQLHFDNVHVVECRQASGIERYLDQPQVRRLAVVQFHWIWGDRGTLRRRQRDTRLKRFGEPRPRAEEHRTHQGDMVRALIRRRQQIERIIGILREAQLDARRIAAGAADPAVFIGGHVSFEIGLPVETPAHINVIVPLGVDASDLERHAPDHLWSIVRHILPSHSRLTEKRPGVGVSAHSQREITSDGVPRRIRIGRELSARTQLDACDAIRVNIRP